MVTGEIKQKLEKTRNNKKYNRSVYITVESHLTRNLRSGLIKAIWFQMGVSQEVWIMVLMLNRI